MENYKLVMNFKDNNKYRLSFNNLVKMTYGFDFENWYKKGLWNDRYNPYSYVYEEEIVANISVNKMDILINGEIKTAIQIGTVMTHPQHRNKGLSSRLIKIVLDEYNQNVDFIYLFANESVLNFYPKFGFSELNESQFSLKFSTNQETNQLLKLDVEEDYNLLLRLTSNRRPISKKFDFVNNQSLLMFYCLYVFSDQLYYSEEDDCLVIYSIEEKTCHLYDVISHNDINLDQLLTKIITNTTDKVVFHFTPTTDMELCVDVLNSNLFIKPLTNSTSQFRFPMTSQA